MKMFYVRTLGQRPMKISGKTCFAGVDASWTQDMTSLVFGFPVGTKIME